MIKDLIDQMEQRLEKVENRRPSDYMTLDRSKRMDISSPLLVLSVGVEIGFFLFLAFLLN